MMLEVVADMPARKTALVYADVDMNLIDGSSIWAQSVVQTLSAAGCHVKFLLKAPVQTDRLLAPLTADRKVHVVRPFEESLLPLAKNSLSPHQVGVIAKQLDAQERFDLVVLRGYRVVNHFAQQLAEFHGRIWAYLTDVPQTVGAFTKSYGLGLSAIASTAKVLLCQTEELRGFLETVVPEASGKALLFPPILTEVPHKDRDPIADAPDALTPIKLVYTGKFAPLWNTLQLTLLPQLLKQEGIKAEVHMVGDKIHQIPSAPDYYPAMKSALESTPGIVWHGGMGREDAIALAARSHVGIGWRDAKLDNSLELSTKVLEYGSAGLPVLLNRTPMHERLLGEDYPLFVNSIEDVVAAVKELSGDPTMLEEARVRTAKAAAEFSFERAVQRTQTYFQRLFPERRRTQAAPLRLLVASHDLKFFNRIQDYLAAAPGVDLRVDDWPELSKHDERRSAELLEWADTIICEWCGPNAAWYSSRKRPSQRLIVRLHRFELEAGFWKNVQIDKVDVVVCVSDSYAELTREMTGWPAEKVRVIPNWVDTLLLDRPKLPGAAFNLGMIGIAPSRKRLDRAVEVLDVLRRKDPRFMLFTKSKMPWDYWWIWNKPAERRHYGSILRKVQQSELLHEAVIFDGFGGDVGAWLRKIGFVLSVSDDESFHLAPAEGMASGSIPVVWNWPGAQTIYDSSWICDSVQTMAETILDAVHEGMDARRQRARAECEARYGLQQIADEWHELVVDSP